MYLKNPKLTVLGAGPGDVDLITVKALKVLKTADVVLYDALVNEELLAFINPKAELIFVGKRRGCYKYQQEQINELIVVRANSHGHVVRLKGGDPFIFGRTTEEKLVSVLIMFCGCASVALFAAFAWTWLEQLSR